MRIYTRQINEIQNPLRMMRRFEIQQQSFIKTVLTAAQENLGSHGEIQTWRFENYRLFPELKYFSLLTSTPERKVQPFKREHGGHQTSGVRLRTKLIRLVSLSLQRMAIQQLNQSMTFIHYVRKSFSGKKTSLGLVTVFTAVFVKLSP